MKTNAQTYPCKKKGKAIGVLLSGLAPHNFGDCILVEAILGLQIPFQVEPSSSQAIHIRVNN
jgi:hypothetical protein